MTFIAPRCYHPASMSQGPPHRYFTWLVLDAFVGVMLGYTALREALFWHYDTTGIGRWLLYNAAISLVIVASTALLNRLDPPAQAQRLSWRRAAARDCAVVLMIFQLLPMLLVSQVGDGQGKGLGLLYVVSDWHQIAREVPSFIIEAPIGAALMSILFVLLVYTGLVRRWRLWTIGAMAVLWSVFVQRTDAVMVEDPALFIILFVPATICAATAMGLQRPKFAARSLAWACLATFIGLVYLGDLPLGEREGWRTTRGITQLYPCDDRPHGYPIRFARDVWVDAPSERIYLAYGPSSGLVGFDLHTGCQTDHWEANGMVRRLWSSPDHAYLYGADDVTADVYALNKRPLTLAHEVDLFAHDGINDGLTVTANPERNRLYVTHYARSAISEMTLDTLEYVRTLDLVDGGWTQIPASVTSMTIGETPEVGYALVGPVDVDRNWRVLRLDLTNLTVQQEGLIPGGTNYIWYSHARQSLWLADGTYASLLEVDAKTLAMKRRVEGPRFSMTFSPIPKHGTLAVAGPVEPDLVILCEESGEIAHRIPVGPKIMGVHYAPALDALYVASGQGVFRIDTTLLRCTP